MDSRPEPAYNPNPKSDADTYSLSSSASTLHEDYEPSLKDSSFRDPSNPWAVTPWYPNGPPPDSGFDDRILYMFVHGAALYQDRRCSAAGKKATQLYLAVVALLVLGWLAGGAYMIMYSLLKLDSDFAKCIVSCLGLWKSYNVGFFF